MHQGWIGLGQGRPIQAKAFHGADGEILDQQIRLAGQAQGDLQAIGLLQVQGQARFVAVQAVEVEGGFDAGFIRHLFAQMFQAPGAVEIKAGRRLHLDHLGAQIGQYLPHHGAGPDPGKFQTAQPRQRCGNIGRGDIVGGCRRALGCHGSRLFANSKRHLRHAVDDEIVPEDAPMDGLVLGINRRNHRAFRQTPLQQLIAAEMGQGLFQQAVGHGAVPGQGEGILEIFAPGPFGIADGQADLPPIAPRAAQ